MCATPAEVAENVRSAMTRGLRKMMRCERNGATLSIVAGGPSLRDTYKNLKGKVVTVNGAHDWLIERGIVPRACGFLDPSPNVAATFTPHRNVQYFVASMCHPSTFDKLDGYNVVLWHASLPPPLDIGDLLPPDSLCIGGGTTVAMRWINQGYALGFRDFHLHAVDSSYRDAEHHAYRQAQDDHIYVPGRISVMGYDTHFAMCRQVYDFFQTMETLERAEFDPITVTLHGDGLLQHAWAKHAGPAPYTTQRGVAA